MTQGEFRSVLVPIEFTRVDEDEDASGETVIGGKATVAIGPQTIRALELAARLARKGDLWLVHAHHDFADHATWLNPSAMDELNRGAMRHATEVLQQVASQHCPDVRLHYAIMPGSPAEVILELAATHAPDAIVLAASSRSRMSRALQGPTADKIIRRANCPVVVVPASVS